jgi:hypothetical protein
MDAAREELAADGLRGASLRPRPPRRLPDLTRPPTSSSTAIRPPASRYAAADPTKGRLGKGEDATGEAATPRGTALESTFSGWGLIASCPKLFPPFVTASPEAARKPAREAVPNAPLLVRS